jgi:hypothetical protein
LKGQWPPQVIQAVGGHTQAFGRVLYTEFLFPFIVVSLVLVVAAIGAIVLAKPAGDEPGALGSISLGSARSRTGLRRLEQLAQAGRQRTDAAALANAALDQVPAGRRGQQQ